MDQEIVGAPEDVDAHLLRRKCLKAKQNRKPIKLVKYRRKGWVRALQLYILYCDECKLFSVKHPAGYGRIKCDRCFYMENVWSLNRCRDKVILPFLYFVPRLLLIPVILILLLLLGGQC